MSSLAQTIVIALSIAAVSVVVLAIALYKIIYTHDKVLENKSR